MGKELVLSEKYASLIWILIQTAYSEGLLPTTVECYYLLKYIKDNYPNLFIDEPNNFFSS